MNTSSKMLTDLLY